MLGEDESRRSSGRGSRSFKVPARLDDVLAKVLDGIEPRPQPDAPELPERYVLIDEIGRGAQSHVYAVFDREMNCKSALKIFNDGGGGRGYREAQALSGVEHENVVRVQDVGLLDGRVYLRMDFVDGTTLRRWVVDRPWRQRLEAFIGAGRGLAAAHRAGIVHRDFKPDNALVRESDNRVVVVDFGLARGLLDVFESSTEPAPSASMSQAFMDPISRSGHLQGTPAYMAPEQFKRDPIDARTDQFSFCVAVYEALDGDRPFEGTTIAQVADAVIHGEIKGPPRNTPQWVWRVLRRGLSVDPDHRYPSMDALLDDLENDPRKWLARVGIAAVAVLAVAGGWQLWEKSEERHAAIAAELREQTEAERAEKEATKRRLRDREDVLTLREAAAVMQTDPTLALAKLKNLSPNSTLWGSSARLLAADALHRGVARDVLVLGETQVPHGLSPDGRIAVTRETDGTVTLHLLDEGTQQVLGDANNGLPVVAFSADGSLIAAQRIPEGVNVWRMSSLHEAPRHLGPSPDQHHRMLFAAGDAGVVTFGRTPEVLRRHAGARQSLGGHEGRVDEVAVDSTGSWAATVDGVRQLRLWDLTTGEARLLDGFAPITFSPEGRLVATDRIECDGRVQSVVRIGEPGDGEEIFCADADVPLESIAFSTGGHRVAASLVDGRVRVWDLRTGERTDLERSDGERSQLRFVTDDMLGSKSPDTTLVVWTLPSLRPHVLRGHVGIAHWARQDDGTIVTFGHEGAIRLWDLPERGDRPLVGQHAAVEHVAHAGSDLLTADSEGVVRLWPQDDPLGRTLLEAGKPVVAMAVSLDGRQLAVGRDDGEVVAANLESGQHRVLADAGQVFGITWDRASRRLAIAPASGGLEILDAATGTAAASISAPGYLIRAADFDNDGQRIITAGWVDDGHVWIRSFVVATGEIDLSIPVEEPGIEAAAFCPLDRYVAMTTIEREVVVWDEASGVRKFGRHDGEVEGIDISSDGKRLITAGADGVVKLWNLATGRSRTVHLGAPLHDVAFAPDGNAFTAVGRAPVAFTGRDHLPHDRAGLRDWVYQATDLEVDPNADTGQW